MRLQPIAAASRRHWAPVWLALTLAFWPLMAACGADDDRPADVSLATLATQEDAYQNKLVRTQGVVRVFEPPRHYWIEDDHPNRVALEPEHLVAPLVGQEVRVVGRFHFDERTGRVIKIKEIAESDAPSSGLRRSSGR
ncbi:MAG: hypothetical protein ACRDY7_01890 [Acidimicrobiia bacterium]